MERSHRTTPRSLPRASRPTPVSCSDTPACWLAETGSWPRILSRPPLRRPAGLGKTLRSLAEERRRGWLRKTLANIAASGFRREAAFRDRLPRIEIRYRKIQADLPEQAFSAIMLERCWRIIQSMPERQHAVAVLRWQLDMKEADVAAILGVDPKTVGTHLHRARRALIAQLGPDNPITGEDPDGGPS